MPLQPAMPASVPVPLAEILAIALEYEQAGRTEQAAKLLGHILAAAPNSPEALHLAGIVAFRRGDGERALDLIGKAIATGIDLPLYLRNICEVYRTLGRLDEALVAGQRAAELARDDPLCLHNLSVVHYHRAEPEAALACAERALMLAPEMPGPHFARAETLLLRGDWAAGWEEYEWRYRVSGVPPLIPPEYIRPQIPHWDGRTLEGHHGSRALLLVADQGFGDIIQFSRYIAWAETICSDIVIAGSPEIEPVLRQVAPHALLVTRWQDCPDYAAFCPLSGLPRLHGTRVNTVPAHVPYLRANPAHAARWADRLAGLVPEGLRRVGLVWAGRPTHGNDRNRSVELADYQALATVPGVALLTLQKGPKIGQAGRYFGRAPLINLGAEIHDYNDTMGVMANLDVVVSVDTSVAHLAGAMGRAVWILLPRAPDWRWLLDREDTVWYPTARLFRRGANEAWPDVAARIATLLRSKTSPSFR